MGVRIARSYVMFAQLLHAVDEGVLDRQARPQTLEKPVQVVAPGFAPKC